MSSIDIIFLIMTAFFVIISIVRGFLVCVISTIRFFVIIPASYFVGNLLQPYLTSGMLSSVPAGLNKILCVIIAFVLLFILSSFLMFFLKKLQKKKDAPLRKTNAFLGAAFGLVKSLMIIITASSLAYYALPFLGDTSGLAHQIETSFIMSFINNVNPFLV